VSVVETSRLLKEKIIQEEQEIGKKNQILEEIRIKTEQIL
jgi:hypothetical protein